MMFKDVYVYTAKNAIPSNTTINKNYIIDRQPRQNFTSLILLSLGNCLSSTSAEMEYKNNFLLLVRRLFTIHGMAYPPMKSKGCGIVSFHSKIVLVVKSKVPRIYDGVKFLFSCFNDTQTSLYI